MVKKENFIEKSYSIYEVHYTAKGDIWGFTEKPMEPFGETLEEIKKDLGYMCEALSKEVLDYDRLSRKLNGLTRNRNSAGTKKKSRSSK